MHFAKCRLAEFLFVLGTVGSCLEQSGSESSDVTLEGLQRRVEELERQLKERDAQANVQAGLSEDGDGIYAKLQVAKSPFSLNFAHLATPPAFFYIEVGTNTRDMLLDEMAGHFGEGAFLVAFEPLLDKYATLMSRFGGKADTWTRLGFQHERSLILPIAVGCTDVARFHVTPVDGCSSVLPPRGAAFSEDPNRQWWDGSVERGCAHGVEQRSVPCVSLEHVIGKWLDGRDIEHLKVDAQGFDLNVVKSAGQYVDRLKTVLLEVQCDTVASVYEGAPNCTTVYWEMQQLGFLTNFDLSFCQTCVEADILFARPDAQWMPPLKSARVLFK